MTIILPDGLQMEKNLDYHNKTGYDFTGLMIVMQWDVQVRFML